MAVAAGLLFVADLFYWLAAFSTPFIKSISYIHIPSDDLHLGNFGWCALANSVCYRHVGYDWHPEIMDKNHLTGSLILVALTAGIGTLTLISVIHSIRDLRSGLLSSLLALFTIFLSTISFLLAIICWGVAHHRFSRLGLDPHYGAALPLVIVGWLLYLAALPFIIIGWLRLRHHREAEAGVGINQTSAAGVNGTEKGRKRWGRKY